MQTTSKHYHGWIQRIDDRQVAFEPMPGEYTSQLKCRRHAVKAAGGEAYKVVVLMCRDEDTCPSRFEAAALAG